MASAQSASSATAIDPPQSSPVPPDRYAGDQACRSCHRKQFDEHSRTAHHLTSRLADEHSILGPFTPGPNILKTSNPDLFFRMDATPLGFFQTAVEGIAPYVISHRERFDFVVGSGKKGQSYLYWKGDQLFELPVSYWIELGEWANSPGYTDGLANFNRKVIPRCLECHATSFAPQPPPENRYSKTDLVLGISCEKCHGPGRQHVMRFSSNAAASIQDGMVNPGKLSRDRQMDLCAWCHAGQGVALAPPFSYLPGQKLENYLELPHPGPDAQVDVHGSQVELLKRSRCFGSSAMTCSTCHDVHVPQHDLIAFSQRCLTCHKAENCGLYQKGEHSITSNCIDCHMPNQPTSLIILAVDGKKLAPRVRNHWIKVYRQSEVTGPQN